MKFGNDEDINIDLTPLIDVVFMLLIFFIMTTTFNKPIIDIILPSSETSEFSSESSDEITITVDSLGTIFFGKDKVDIEKVTDLLSRNQSAQLNLNIDKNAPFQSFLSLVDIAKKERDGKFIITTED